MSEQEFGKKEVESIELDPFLEEYAHVTGEPLSVCWRGERPDFICARTSGALAAALPPGGAGGS